MSWGYETSFTVEHDETLKKRVSCKDCKYYCQSDLSCLKRPIYMPEDGFNMWHDCENFRINRDVPNYAEKERQLLRMGKLSSFDSKKSDEKKKTASETVLSKKNNTCNEDRLFIAEKIRFKGELCYRIQTSANHCYMIPCKDVKTKEEALILVKKELGLYQSRREAEELLKQGKMA